MQFQIEVKIFTEVVLVEVNFYNIVEGIVFHINLT